MTYCPIITPIILTFAFVALIACNSASNNQKPPSQATASPAPAQTPTVIVTSPVSQELSRSLRLPGELQAYQDTAIYARVQGFIEEIKVDRGTFVKQGQSPACARLNSTHSAPKPKPKFAPSRHNASKRLRESAASAPSASRPKRNSPLTMRHISD